MRKLLEKLPFWAKLDGAEQAMAENAAVVRQYRAGDLLYGTNNNCLGMVHILSGSLRAYILSEEGREVTLYRLAEGDMGILTSSGVLSNISFETHLAAVGDTEVLIIPDDVYTVLTGQNMALRCFTYELAVERLSVIMWVFQQILFAGFDQRLAGFLVEEYRRSGSREICMTQEQIAEYVNSAREVVARMLKRFAGEGLIENRRGTIELLDIPALTRISGKSERN